ncbi:MAG: FkbM family methyltransferase [Schwartzia succinivorans]|nr:FkbM family methyltransferase [Schwartzia succinivorans]
MNREAKQEILDNRFVQEIMICAHTKFGSDTYQGKFCISCFRRLLCATLYPIHRELGEMEAFYKTVVPNESPTASSYLYLEHKKENAVLDFQYEGREIHLYLPYAKYDSLQSRVMRKRNFYEEQSLRSVKEKYLKPGMVYLDCGANIGNHTVFFARVADAKKVYAFEGNPITHAVLVKNVELNHIQKVVQGYNCVLGEKNGTAETSFYTPFNMGGTAFHESDDGIEMRAIDSFNFGEKIDFIKMDVEGFEDHVLKGMGTVLRRDKPLLWVEIFDEHYKSVSSLLHEYGYERIEVFEGDNYIFRSKF